MYTQSNLLADTDIYEASFYATIHVSYRVDVWILECIGRQICPTTQNCKIFAISEYQQHLQDHIL